MVAVTCGNAQDTLWVWPYPSAANVSVAVNCNVDAGGGQYTYYYALTSAPTSQQSIESFYVDHNSGIDSLTSPNQWIGLPSATRTAVMWDARNSEYRVLPSGNLSGFSVTSLGIPCISMFYVRGYAYIPPFEDNTPDSTTGGDVFENSFKGKTIAPRVPPTPFNGLIFLDTLKSYVTQSLSLGWISSKTTAKKYTSLFGRAKSDIQAANVPSALTRLDTVLMQVHADCGATLTSEAYALLRFNTEYLSRMLITGAAGKPDRR